MYHPSKVPSPNNQTPPQAGACGLFPTVLYKSLNSNSSCPPSGTSPTTLPGLPATTEKLGTTIELGTTAPSKILT